jgi:hypothetical protein
MRATVNVQHLTGDLARLGEIKHGFCDVLSARNLAAWKSPLWLRE